MNTAQVGLIPSVGEETVAAVWAPSSDINANSQVSLVISQPLSSADTNILNHCKIPETCRKGALPCILSPLGFHLPTGTKEKIWKGEFLDLLSLLPSAKEFVHKYSGREEKSEEDRRRPVNKSFNNWLQAFCIFTGVLCEKHPELITGLFQHPDLVLVAYKSFGGTA